MVLSSLMQLNSHEIWDTDQSDEDEDNDDQVECVTKQQQYLRYCRTLSGFLLSWQYRFHLSDTAVSALVIFIASFLTLLNAVVNSKFLFSMLTCLPRTVSMCRNMLGVKKSFQTFVCRVKCNSLYELGSCFDKLNGKPASKRCVHVEYPNHPMVHFRSKKCGTLLLKEVKIGSKQFHYPFRNYCYKSLKESLNRLMCRKDFITNCELWRNREHVPHVLEDIYDGRVWHDFQCVGGRDFLKQPNAFALMLNVDWFQPFKHTQYSVGAMYMVLMNLPRAE